MSGKRATRERVLEAACEVFARQGYRDATVQAICAAAGANGAAVNYYFGGKQRLYLAVWAHLYDTVQRPHSEAVGAIVDPASRLREIVVQRVREVFDDGVAGRFRRLIHSEMNDPTELHAVLRDRFLAPMRDTLTVTVAELLDRPVSDPVVRRCAFSLQSQLVSLARLRFKIDSRVIRDLLGTAAPSRQQVQELAEHIVAFVTGGIRAVSATRMRPVKGGRKGRNV